MRRTLFLFTLLAPLLTAGTTNAFDSEKESFIDKDLSNWQGLISEYWSYKNDALVGYTPKDPGYNTFLCSKKTYKDFELSFKVRLKDGIGNSGVQIRSKLVDDKKFVVAGPQCDIGQGYWGSLYGERFNKEGKFAGGHMMKAAGKEAQKEILKSDFNDYSIRCVGKKVTIKVNGVTTVDEEFDILPEEGIIAFQLHAGYKSMEVTFKDIKFKELK